MHTRLRTSIFILAASACVVTCGPSRGRGSGDGGNSNGDGAHGSNGGDGGMPGPVCNDAPCACTAAGGTWDGTKCTLTENPGGLGSGAQGTLGGGGTADGAFKFLYPYDQTVFPRGLLPPTLQFAGTAPSAVLVRITSSTVDYTGWFGASNPGRVTPSTAAWNAITMAATATDPLAVKVTKMSGSAVTGPVTESWKIAPGSLRGVIYYETYGSPILGGIASVGIMKINPGATTPTPVKSGCGNVCHTASADGSTLVAASGLFGLNSTSYDLASNAAVRKAQTDQSFVYGGLTPDGSMVMSASNYRTWTGAASKLYSSSSGANLSAPGWDGTITNAAMPAFSPDGTKIVFNHEDTGHGHSLAVMSVNLASKTFSALADIASESTLYLGWPAFTPDTKAVVYHAGNSEMFETDAGSNSTTSTGDLYTVDVASHTKHRLDALDGYAGAATYLPASDPNLNFAPTVLPEAVGGYFWVVFTSHRSYGNTLPSLDNNDQNGKLWVAALDIGAAPGTDSSHPAFYLDGQEAAADNLRGFWVFDPCHADGDGCSAGDQCCGGYCEPDGGGNKVCTSTPPACGGEYDKCGNGTSCCDGLTCIDGKCAVVIQ